ncbi:hypothetical protein FSP39_007909 [Pinctada imbricata]|uniref:Integrase catalytic domain-containing protein n=1 Tax=Pinctada imbricata TaxID=66713 RepID=A0AA88XEU3_PINIB|nr:hypothetical protein FSP39_007909 [Pinctada imbricata]
MATVGGSTQTGGTEMEQKTSTQKEDTTVQDTDRHDPDPKDKGDTTEETSEQRVRKSTEKGEAMFNEKLEKYKKTIKTLIEKLSDAIMKGATCENDVTVLTSVKSSINTQYDTYKAKYREFLNFLHRERTTSSIDEMEGQVVLYEELTTRVKGAISKIESTISLILEEGSMSRTSALSAQKREAAKVRFKIAEEKALIRKQKAQLEREMKVRAAETEQMYTDLDADMELLNIKEEYQIAEAELSMDRLEDDNPDINLPTTTSYEKSRDYVAGMDRGLNPDAEPFSMLKPTITQIPSSVKFPTVAHNAPVCTPAALGPQGNVYGQTTYGAHPLYQAPPLMSIPQPASQGAQDLTNFLLRKDLILQRMQNFNDDPSTYFVWKGTFKNVIEDARVTAHEEIQLLLRWLGPESVKQATSIRRANPNNSESALLKIWERLDERFGAPELVDSTLRNKVKNLPRITLPKDKTKLYELHDLLAEIESFKQNPKYTALFAYYDTSGGVNPIISKLPTNLQNKWIERASKYKRDKGVLFPPFSYFVSFIREITSTLNDPSFSLDVQGSWQRSPPVPQQNTGRHVISRKTQLQPENQELQPPAHREVPCLLHPHCESHKLEDCKAFRKMSIDERKLFLTQNRLCFRCCSPDHVKRKCKQNIKCGECQSTRHVTSMHEQHVQGSPSVGNNSLGDNSPADLHGGEETKPLKAYCTEICGEGFKGRSCSKTVLVRIYPKGKPLPSVVTYAMLDEHCNKTLASSQLLDDLEVEGEEISYTLKSCSGKFKAIGRRAHNFYIESLDKTACLELPNIIECSDIPTDTSEIPTPEIAHFYPHLKPIAKHIPEYDPSCYIGLLIGRDLLRAHYVQEQIIGPMETPFAQKLCLGWVIVGEVCLDKRHTPETVRSFKTNVFRDGRGSIFEPCNNDLNIQEDDLFERKPDDNEPGLSTEDREFLKIMDTECVRNEQGNWMAPLPFRSPREAMPNNKPVALKRAKVLDVSLRRDRVKHDHFVEFMQKVIDSGAAEVAPELPHGKEAWYLPIFGVYHPKKPDKIRGVFDSSATYQGVSLNKVLMSGPNLTNSLVGILMRFRKNEYAISGDIEQMFYSFLVKEEHRDHLRFLWYKDNNTENELIDYRMCAHVFGNSPSPAVATYGLRKSVLSAETDVREFVNSNFYVDDAFTSLPTKEEAIELMKRTQKTLEKEGNLRLHKIVSNSPDVMQSFQKEDLGKEVKSINLDVDALPIHQSLGMSWDMDKDSFVFDIQLQNKPHTRRGFLSLLHSIYDPLGFVAPMLLEGKIILREIAAISDWDQALDAKYIDRWERWRTSIQSLETLVIPRTYASISLSVTKGVEIHIFCDASQDAIAAVAYLKVKHEGSSHCSFVFGKVKLAPSHGHTIPRLELCAAVLATEVGKTVTQSLHHPVTNVQYYSDSRVVLGYIHNKVRRFYNYVSNRVDRILSISEPSQWSYVSTKENPADHGTRGLQTAELLHEKWLKAPEVLNNTTHEMEEYPLVVPDADKEIRVEVYATKASVDHVVNEKSAKFSSWSRLVSAMSVLKSCMRRRKCQKAINDLSIRQDTENFLLCLAQRQHFAEDVCSLQHGSAVDKSSTIASLSPYLDDQGILRVGGRLNQGALPIEQRNPIILSKDMHVTKLIIRHFHEKVAHQGRLITEGAIRNNGFWIVGAKRMISSLINNCFVCRRLRRKPEIQRMADLPVDRLTPAPPFSSVGVDAFGPWSIVSRKTRGGMAESKRWAIMFTCLVTRAIHIEVIESMTSSSFINSVRRLVALRGNVKEFRSDRGSNFVGAIEDLKIDVQTGAVKDYLSKSRITWIFNAPHSSHMGGVWERMIGLTRNILNAVLLGPKGKNLTHEVLVTLMAEVAAIINSRPIAPISYDSDVPIVLSPSMLLNQKFSGDAPTLIDMDVRNIYREHWRQVQVLSDMFWKMWRERYLQTLQEKRKWTAEHRNMKEGDIVLFRDPEAPRSQWPLAIVEKVFPSKDGLVRKVDVRLSVNGKICRYTRPISELVLLLD